MKNKIKQITLLLILSMTIASLFNISHAQNSSTKTTTVLKIATWLPSSHIINATVLKQWASWIEKDTKGKIKIIFEYPKTHPKNMLNLVKSGKYDGSWIYHGFLPGQFKSAELVELPLNDVGPEAASVAHWRIYNKYFRDLNEYEGMQLIATFTHGEAQLHSKEPISSLDQLKGKKARISGATGIQAEIANRLNLKGIIAPPERVFEMFKNNEISIAFMPMIEKKSLKLKEVSPYTYKFNGGLYLGSFGVFMNPESLKKLAKQDRVALMKNSGEKLSRFAGITWNNEDIKGEKDALEFGNSISRATPTMRDDYENLTLGIDDLWIKKANDMGLNGDRILEEYRRLSLCGSITSEI